MGLFEKLFPQREREGAVRGYFQTLNSYQPKFNTFSGGIYEAQITRAAIHATATHASKLKPEIKGRDSLARLMQFRPNPWMSTSQFLYRTATILEVENNAFIVPLYDEMLTRIVGYYPIVPTQTEICNISGEPWLRYRFQTGQTALIELRKVGVLTKFQFKDDFFGSNNHALLPTIRLIDTQNQGIIEGVKNAASIRFLAKLGTATRPEDIDKERKRFVADNFAAENNGGVMMFDTKYSDVKQIDSKPFVADAEQMKTINESVYNYFGVNEKILRNEWDEATYTAFYEGKIEPFALQLGLAMTNMTFSDREIAFGDSIMFSANRLQYASSGSKLQVSQQLLDRGVLSRNEVREIWQLPSIDGGDDYVIRGEYVNAKEQINKESEDDIKG